MFHQHRQQSIFLAGERHKPVIQQRALLIEVHLEVLVTIRWYGFAGCLSRSHDSLLYRFPTIDARDEVRWVFVGLEKTLKKETRVSGGGGLRPPRPVDGPLLQ